MPNSKTKGDISTAKVMAALLECGYIILIPWGDNQSYDLVVDLGNGVFRRIQCKTARPKPRSPGSIIFNTHSTYLTRNGAVVKHYDGLIDYYGVYYSGNVYLIPISEATTRHLCTLRLSEKYAKTANNQSRFAEDYLIEAVQIS